MKMESLLYYIKRLLVRSSHNSLLFECKCLPISMMWTRFEKNLLRKRDIYLCIYLLILDFINFMKYTVVTKVGDDFTFKNANKVGDNRMLFQFWPVLLGSLLSHLISYCLHPFSVKCIVCLNIYGKCVKLLSYRMSV